MKIIFILTLIFAVASFSPYALSSPGKRTYLGSDIENGGEASQEISQEISQEVPQEVPQEISQETPSQSHSEECNLTENVPQEQIQEQTQEQIDKKELLENEDMVRAINKLVLTKQIHSEKDIPIEELKNSLSRTGDYSIENPTGVSETVVSQQPIISHEGIPLKWEYKQ